MNGDPHIEHFYQDGAAYDAACDGTFDRKFYLAQAHQAGGSVLELACGTGRILIPLALAGFNAMGIDRSRAMLAQAWRKAEAQGLDIDWRCADMRDFSIGRRFSLIILGYNTLCHVLTIADFEAMTACVRRHLSPGGRFVIDVFVPSLKILLRHPAQRGAFARYPSPDGPGKVVIKATNDYRADTQISQNKTFTNRPGHKREVVGSLPMRMYFPQELDALLKYNGLPVMHKYGDYDGGAFTATSGKQIIVCSKARR